MPLNRIPPLWAIVMLASTIALAGSPATRPATVPARTTAASTAESFPTPAELIARMRKLQAEKEKLLKVAYFDLSKPVIEKPADFSFFGETRIPARSLVARIHQAQSDKDIRGILVTLTDTELNFAQAQEVRDALAEARKAGKKVFVYADAYDTVSYTVACGASDVCMLGGGEVMMPGIGLETMFAKGLLDKLGVKADYVQIGEYKGAEEQMTRTGPSEELRGELNKIVDSLFDQIVDGVARHRNLSRDAVRSAIDEALVGGRQARERGLVDHLVDMDGLRGLIAGKLGDPIDLLAQYGEPQREAIDFSNPFALLQVFTRKPEPPSKPTVALIYAEGTIIDGEGGEGLFGGGSVGSEDMRKAFRIAVRDENVKAIVLRIDSPGGSALASEAIWQAARRAAGQKPLIVSIGSTAASGGYYVACAGETIYADPSAIVGSIGVVGGKLVLKGLMDKVGISTESFTRGRHADLFSSSQGFSEGERRLVTAWMRQTYEQFTERVMSTRKGRIKDIDQVARGRIFLAQQARELGMVDALGGVEDAIAAAAARARLKSGDYEVRVVPTPKTLADLFTGDGEKAAMPEVKLTVMEDSLLRALPRPVRRAMGQQLQSLRLLQQRPVVLVSPYVVTVR